MTVCPALFPPWLRTTISARAVSTSIILPLPSSPHCIPIKIVFAMENRNLGKKFSRCIRQGHSRDLPTDNKLAESPRKKFRRCIILNNGRSLRRFPQCSKHDQRCPLPLPV